MINRIGFDLLPLLKSADNFARVVIHPYFSSLCLGVKGEIYEIGAEKRREEQKTPTHRRRARAFRAFN